MNIWPFNRMKVESAPVPLAPPDMRVPRIKVGSVCEVCHKRHTAIGHYKRCARRADESALAAIGGLVDGPVE